MSWFRRKSKTEAARKEADQKICAPVSGKFVRQADLPDPVFAQGMMGEAFGIDPQDEVVVSPFDGTVAMTFPTGHALGLKRADGLELLIHIGIDTVQLKGKGFDMLKETGDSVKRGEPLVRVQTEAIRQAGWDPTVICVFTTPAQGKEELPHAAEVAAGDPLFDVPAA